jgi:hypothetical protein
VERGRIGGDGIEREMGDRRRLSVESEGGSKPRF